MKTPTIIWAGLLLVQAVSPLASDAVQREAATPRQDLVLWYRQPGEKWLEGMPLGNGFMGAMVFGGLQRERIALNESSFWSGRPHDYDNPDAFKYFRRRPGLRGAAPAA